MADLVLKLQGYAKKEATASSLATPIALGTYHNTGGTRPSIGGVPIAAFDPTETITQTIAQRNSSPYMQAPMGLRARGGHRDGEEDSDNGSGSASDDDRSDDDAFQGDGDDDDGPRLDTGEEDERSESPTHSEYAHQSVLLQAARSLHASVRARIEKKLVHLKTDLERHPSFKQRKAKVEHELSELIKCIGLSNVECVWSYPTSDVFLDNQNRPEPTGITMVVRGSTPIAPLMFIKWGQHRAAVRLPVSDVKADSAAHFKTAVDSGEVLDEATSGAEELLADESHLHVPMLATDGSVAFCSGFDRSAASGNYDSVVVTNHSARALAVARRMLQERPDMTVREFFRHPAYTALVCFGELETLAVMAEAVKVLRPKHDSKQQVTHDLGFDSKHQSVKMRLTEPALSAPLCYMRQVKASDSLSSPDPNPTSSDLYEIHIGTFGEPSGILHRDATDHLRKADASSSFGYIFNDGPQVGFTFHVPTPEGSLGARRLWRAASIRDLRLASKPTSDDGAAVPPAGDSASSATFGSRSSEAHGDLPSAQHGYPSSGFYLDIADRSNDKGKPVISSGMMRPQHCSTAYFAAEEAARLGHHSLRSEINQMLSTLFPPTKFVGTYVVDSKSLYVGGINSCMCDFQTLMDASAFNGVVTICSANLPVFLQVQYLLACAENAALTKDPKHHHPKQGEVVPSVLSGGRMRLRQQQLRDLHHHYPGRFDQAASPAVNSFPPYHDHAVSSSQQFLEEYREVMEIAQLMSLEHHRHRVQQSAAENESDSE